MRGRLTSSVGVGASMRVQGQPLFGALDFAKQADCSLAEPAQDRSRHVPLEHLSIAFADDHEPIVHRFGAHGFKSDNAAHSSPSRLIPVGENAPSASAVNGAILSKGLIPEETFLAGLLA